MRNATILTELRGINGRLDHIDVRLDSINNRIDGLHNRIDAVIDAVADLRRDFASHDHGETK